MKLAEIITEYCYENNITIKQLANKLNMQSTHLYSYVNGNTLPNIETIVKIANFIDCSIDYLVGLDTNPKSFNFSHNFDKSKFFVRYDALLTKNKIKNHKLALKLNFAPAGYKHWKNGAIPHLDTLYEIAKYFNVSIDYLIGRSDD